VKRKFGNKKLDSESSRKGAIEMRHRILATAAIGLMVLPMAVYSQPHGGKGFFRPEGEHFLGGDRRLEAAAEYLELTDGQQVEWEGILERHRETVRLEWQGLAELRQQFRDLAETENPDLAELGGIALTMHRGTEAMRDMRSDLNEELQSILTPDQAEKFEALQAARETVRPRGERRRPHHGARSGSGG
jgi:Spy/CpxP family protein refolding chaperone